MLPKAPACQITVVPKVRLADPRETATSSQGISGYISVMAALKFAYFLITEIMSCSNNREISLIGDLLIPYGRQNI
jgi:hypothetical protein